MANHTHTRIHTHIYKNRNRRKKEWKWIWMCCCYWFCCVFFALLANIWGHPSNCCDEMTTTTHTHIQHKRQCNTFRLCMVNVSILLLLLLVQRASQTINQRIRKKLRRKHPNQKNYSHTYTFIHTHRERECERDGKTHLYMLLVEKVFHKKYHRHRKRDILLILQTNIKYIRIDIYERV